MAVKLIYGIDSSNKIVTIKEVVKGIACGCICPECKTLLIARKGEINEHHFAHKNGSVCAHAPETAIHILAKQIIFENRQIVLTREVFFKYNSAKLETKIGQIIPDVFVAESAENTLLIEIVVTNDVSPQKEKYLRQNGLRTLVIYLHNVPRDISRKILEEQVLFNYSNRRIIESKRVVELPRLNFDWRAAAIGIGIIWFLLLD